jgi:hypothetical protein
VRWWGKILVRPYTLVLTTEQLTAITVCLLVLAGAVGDSIVLRVLLVLAALMAAATLLVRISAGSSTRPRRDHARGINRGAKPGRLRCFLRPM